MKAKKLVRLAKAERSIARWEREHPEQYPVVAKSAGGAAIVSKSAVVGMVAEIVRDRLARMAAEVTEHTAEVAKLRRYQATAIPPLYGTVNRDGSWTPLVETGRQVAKGGPAEVFAAAAAASDSPNDREQLAARAALETLKGDTPWNR